VASHWKEGAVHHSATTLTLVRNHWEAQLKDNGNHGTVEYHGISYYNILYSYIVAVKWHMDAYRGKMAHTCARFDETHSNPPSTSNP